MLQQIDQLTCNLEIDYSEVVEETIIPFFIELDLAESNLDPGPDENQRFCYNVSGVGSDTPLYADLSHLVLGICEDIPEEQITNIFVEIDGIEQEVDFGEGGNVELRTSENPDPPTGCSGLKFDFEVDKVDGEMSICFDLTVPYPIGPNPVCLAAANSTANGLNICGPACEVIQGCEATAYQASSVCVPVTITPFAIPGTTTTFCCGDPIVTTPPPTCGGVEEGSCIFTITQNICVSVPVEFGATTTVGDTFVQCGEVSSENICINCGDVNDIGITSQKNAINSSKNSMRDVSVTTPII